MATIQQSIDINIPIHAVYGQLTRFEDYPRFMEEVDEVRQIDDTHLHWKTIMSNRPVEWDAEITERQQDQCIAWRNIGGPTNAGRVDVQPVGTDKSRVTLTLHAEPEQVPGSSSGNSEQEMSQRLRLDLVRLKEFIEASGQQPATSRGERLLTEDGMPDAQGDRGSLRNSPVSTSSYAAGSEGWSGDEDTTSPMTSAPPSSSSSSSAHLAAEQRNDATGSVAPSASGGMDGMRHVGQMPHDTSAERHGGVPAPDAAGKVAQQGVPPQSQGAQASRGAPAPDLQAVPERGTQPGAGRAADGGSTGVDGTAAAVGAAGGTDASAGARMSGSKGPGHGSGAPGGAATAGSTDVQGGGAQGNSVSPAAGASAAGGTGLGSSATADDTRTGTGTESGGGTALTGGSGGAAGNTKGSAGPSDKP